MNELRRWLDNYGPIEQHDAGPSCIQLNNSDSEYRERAAVIAALPALLGMLDAITDDHYPDIGTDISDSTWLECRCGWDSAASKLGWWEHVVLALEPSPERDRWIASHAGTT